MWQKTVQTWLTDPAISNLQLHPIADRFNDPKILLFLADSTLPMGLRLRMDTMGPSDAPRVRGGGRPRTRPLVGCEVGATCAAATALHAGAGAVTAAGGVSDAGAAAGAASAALGAGARSPRGDVEAGAGARSPRCDVAAGAGTGAPAPTAVVRDRGVCPSPSDAGGGRRSGNPGQVATPTSLPRPPPPPPPPSPPAAADPVAAGGAACFGGGAGPDSSAAVPRPGDAGMPPAGMGVKCLTAEASPGTSSPWRSAAAAGGGATKLVLAAQVGARAGGSTPPSLAAAAGPCDAAGLPRQTPAGADLPCPYAQCASSTSWPAALDFSPIGFRYGTSTQYAQLQPVGSYMAHFPYGTPAPAQYFYPPWVPGIGHVRQSESSQAASNEVSSSCRQRKIRKLLTPADADVQTRLVEMEELCTKLTANLSKETKRAEQERARAEQERALRKEQTKRAGHEAKRADREAGRAKAAETKAEDRRKAADAWRKKAERARDKLADCRVGPP